MKIVALRAGHPQFIWIPLYELNKYFQFLGSVPHEPRQIQIEPRITVKAPKTREGIPNIDIVFPDGHEDTMVLHRHYESPKARMAGELHCNFFGHLKNDPRACVAVTGCLGRENMEFTINSKHSIHTNMYILEKNGNLKLIESKLKVYLCYIANIVFIMYLG